MLLTDTTETCFQVVAELELEKEQPERAAPSPRARRPPARIVAAARRGRRSARSPRRRRWRRAKCACACTWPSSRTTPEGGRHGAMLA